MAKVEMDDNCLQRQSACLYAEMVVENSDLVAEHDRCMQREGNTFSTFLRRPDRDEQKSSEMWKSGRLRSARDGNINSNEDQKNSKSSTLHTIISQMGRTNSFLAMHWKFVLVAAILCVFLNEGRLCSASCYGLGATGRAILTDLEGVISDHPNESYPMDTECEWLITAPSPDMKIMLSFSSFATECSYDFVTVYDGNSHQSPVIAALSGDFVPSTIMAESGQMLIFLYSDRNYNLHGFDATYTIDNCTHACSGHGTCVDHSCVCDTGYRGDSCDRLSCPYECGYQWSAGSCQTSTDVKCACAEGFVGEGCSLATNSNLGWGQSFLVSSGDTQGLSRRVAHASVYHDDTDSLWVFGGYDLTSPLDDLIQYSFETNGWTEIHPNGSAKPSARYHHIMELYDNHLLVFGGLLTNGSHSNELWSFDLTTLTWELLPEDTDSVPPGLAHHSSCIVEYSYLVIIGGQSETNSFLGSIYKYDLQLLQGWEEISPKGGLGHEVKLIDHTSVYHYDTKSIIVFGGLQPQQVRYSQISKRISTVYAFHFDDCYWTRLSSSGSIRERSYHSANIIGNYMVVYGGNVHQHLSLGQGGQVIQNDYGDNEKCFEDGIELYHLGCHQWVSFDDLAHDFIDAEDRNSFNVTRGRFGHAAAVRDGTTLLVVGGFNGVTLGDVVAFKMPGSIAVNPATSNQSLDLCGHHTDEDSCSVDPECGWCSNPSGCLSFSDDQSCLGSFTTSDCPGICNTLETCEACLIWGQGPQTSTFDPTVTRVNQQCGWCVQERKCYFLSAPTGYCSTGSPEAGWWGDSGTFIADFDQCKTNDLPPGLTWIKYSYPKNVSNPDEVTIVPDTRQTFKPIVSLTSDQQFIEESSTTAVYKGFIHPLGATPPDGEPDLQVWLKAGKATATLEISTDDTPANAELVAEIATSSSSSNEIKEAERANGGDIFPATAAGNKYYVMQEEVRPNRYTSFISSIMELHWNGNLQSSTAEYQEFTSEYIQPYASDTCDDYPTCRGCLTDASCGWCPLSSTCEMRSGVTLSMDHCGTEASRPIEHYLVVDSENCGNCSQYWACDLCTSDPLCEWLSGKAECTRRGRFSDAVTDTAQCPLQCHEVTECAACVNEVNCAWCAETGSCFHFPSYVSSYIHAECSHWFDQEDNECPSCSSHTECDSCLDTFQCGWCGNVNDPVIGLCMSGDFNGPYTGPNCTQQVADAHNTSLSDPADWSYDRCPDVDECRLQRDNCHANATCVNTYEAYDCNCNPGYQGDGSEFCNRTCYYTCEFGDCSGAPDYECICDLGWTGVACNISCGCNNHSTCVNGVGLCDACQDWSNGTYCELCLPGSYGNATTPVGCQECNCNGHGNESLGNCDIKTGVCYCTGNTMGDNCESCVSGYFGQPQTGGKCYQECEGRSILTHAQSSTLGSYEGEGVETPTHGYCLWVLTPYASLQEASAATHSPGAISLTIDSLDVECGRDSVDVYDGIPAQLWADFSVAGQSTKLGSFCGHQAVSSITTAAYSGVMTIIFQANVSTSSPTQGFTAVYDVHTCSKDCDGNWHCVNDDEDDLDDDRLCECTDDFVGDNCEVETCPGDCGVDVGRGTCNTDLHLCECADGYGGSSCEYSTTESSYESKAVWSLLYDASRLSATDLTVTNVGPGSRMGHTMVADDNGKLWLFGGYSHDNQRLNDVWSFDTSTSQWTNHPTGNSPAPEPRNYHAASYVTPNQMIVSGGLSDAGLYSDWWLFSLVDHVWTEITPPISNLEIAGHTMTMIDDTTLLVVGGYSPKDGLLSRIVTFDTGNLMGKYKSSSGTPPTGLFGHSTVWHAETEALYAFGGFRFHLQSLAVSDKLYSYHVPSAGWSILPSEGYQPEARMYHSAVTFSDYMVVMGGFSDGETIDDNLLVYHYKCNKWQALDAQGMTVGAQPQDLHSHAAAKKDEKVYLFGGYDGSTYGTMSKAVFPSDLCVLQSTLAGCVGTAGCSACVQGNSTLVACMSNDNISPDSCASPNTLHNGTKCNKKYIESRSCTALSICSECVTVYPAHFNAQQSCKWCYNCPDGACIPATSSCQEEHNCQVESQNEYLDRSACSETSCEASDCSKCTSDNSCIWTRQFKRSSETRRLLNYKPIYDWNCFSNRLLTVAPSDYEIETVPPLSCPTLCHQHTTCGDCLSSVGADGGWQECMWSSWLNKCMSPTFLHLRCAVGECGPVVQGGSDNCPTPCFANSQCSHCLRQAWCGWCPVPNHNGSGICLSGGLREPTDGVCTSQEISWNYQEPLPGDVINATAGGIQGTPDWTYMTCPPENECVNGNHDCGENENCTDTYESFECNCKKGYERNGVDGPCEPVCKQNCGGHGVCVAPNQCECSFGYVGYNCSIPCQCNGHSNCLGEHATDQCIQCFNNTTGDHCEHCKPLFVGDPKDGGSCVPCYDYCNRNTPICLSHVNYLSAQGANISPSNISELFPVGPLADDVFCIDCGNFSEGNMCESCIDGYFKLGDNCQQCNCNGHGDICDKTRGLCEDCYNNTNSPRCDADNAENCWKDQCSECINDLFKGVPKDSHQCYRQMQVDNDICFSDQLNCPIAPDPLQNGAASFFVIMPKYSDLDIRLTVDITYGALDVYVTYDAEIFIVEYDEELQQQVITIDEVHLTSSSTRKRRSFRELYFPDIGHEIEFLHRERRSGNTTVMPEVISGESDFEEIASHGLNTFISIEDQNFITVVRDLRNRLVITFPRHRHALTSRRFYIALVGRGAESLDSTQGIMYFRQDQPHIDLFIFFSVFLSCFFLFLAFLIGIWKVKVGVEARQHRRLHLLEMEHRASRPFGQVLLYYEAPNVQHHGAPAPAPQGTKGHLLSKKHHRLPRIRGRGDPVGGAANRERDMEEVALNAPETINARFMPGVIASEPTDDGMATVGTIVLALPGQMRAPVRACLGSALLTLKTTTKQSSQDAQNAARQQRQTKPLKSNICNSNSRR